MYLQPGVRTEPCVYKPNLRKDQGSNAFILESSLQTDSDWPVEEGGGGVEQYKVSYVYRMSELASVLRHTIPFS